MLSRSAPDRRTRNPGPDLPPLVQRSAPDGAHGLALCRALSFAAALSCLILPLALAARHEAAELALARATPWRLSLRLSQEAILPLLDPR